MTDRQTLDLLAAWLLERGIGDDSDHAREIGRRVLQRLLQNGEQLQESVAP